MSQLIDGRHGTYKKNGDKLKNKLKVNGGQNKFELHKLLINVDLT